jgi:hypothetical protein
MTRYRVRVKLWSRASAELLRPSQRPWQTQYPWTYLVPIYPWVSETHRVWPKADGGWLRRRI